jgi:hypothetical protein
VQEFEKIKDECKRADNGRILLPQVNPVCGISRSLMLSIDDAAA